MQKEGRKHKKGREKEKRARSKKKRREGDMEEEMEDLLIVSRFG